MKRVSRIISLIAILVWTVSCTHKELLYDVDWTVALNVEFDWSKAPEANPEGMSVYVFDLDKPGTRPDRFDLMGAAGGRIKIVPGRYSFACINNDVENILFKNDRSYSDFSICTRNISFESGMNISSRLSIISRASNTSGTCIMSPDSCWTGTVENVLVERGDESRKILFTPEISVTTVDVIVKNADNLKYSTEFGGTLDNMAAGFRLSDRTVDPDVAHYSFPLYSDGITTLSTSFTVFGRDAAAALNHTMTVYAVLADGREWKKTFDVTDQVQSAPDPKHIVIVVSGLEVPKPIVNGSGFRPKVDDWQTKEIEVGMYNLKRN